MNLPEHKPFRLTVLLPYPFDRPFDYLVPEGMALAPGDIVQAPLGGRLAVGVVWDDPPNFALPAKRLKPVKEKLDAPGFPEQLRQFIDWVANYTMAKRGEALALALKPGLLERPDPSYGWEIGAVAEAARITPARAKVLAALPSLTAPNTVELARAGAVSPGIIRAMADAGLIVPAQRDDRAPRLDPDHPAPVLSPSQAMAAEALRQAVHKSYSVTLLEGVTGSGKTEVYLEAVAEALRSDKQVLVLLPEIALSAQFIDRFAARFGASPLVWHSEVTPRVRRATWHAVAEGRARFVVGARSALFLPFTKLGLIIVDEEHETAYKQEDGVAYHARDMAVVRAKLASAPVVLASATPSLESVMNAEAGRYRHLVLTERHGGAAMPEVAALDLRATPPPRGRFLAPPLVEAVRATFERGEQAMLFLNRRGYAPLTLCRACGHRIACPNCTAWLVEHRNRGTLLCHHCAHEELIPEACPSCGAAESLVPVGPGVERIEEEAAALFPDARRLVMTSDAIAGPQAAADAAHAIVGGAVDLIIGTQMIAKGWHFPALTLVGVVDADLGLMGADLRAGERSVQLLHQVAGRAGRADKPGRVLLQTYDPEHPVMQALVAGDLAGFRAQEAALRRPGHWPPFGRLAALIVSAGEPEVAAEAARALGRTAPEMDGLIVLGPAPAPFALLRGRHRHRLLIKARRDIQVQPILRDWLKRAAPPRAARVDIDIDPSSFL